MDRPQLAFMASMALGLALIGWHFYGVLRKHRLRRRLAASGCYRSSRWNRKKAWTWITTGLFCLLGVALFSMEDRLESAVGRGVSKLILWGGLFAATLAFMLLRGLQQYDRVASQATFLIEANGFDEAVELLTRALAAKPTPRRWAMLGLAHYRNERFDRAVDAYREAVRLDPQTLLYSINLALALSSAGRGAEAIALLDEHRREHPNEAALAMGSALVLADLERADEAREQLRIATELVEAAEDDQTVDLANRNLLGQECRKRLDGLSTRGFPVQLRRTEPT